MVDRIDISYKTPLSQIGWIQTRGSYADCFKTTNLDRCDYDNSSVGIINPQNISLTDDYTAYWPTNGQYCNCCSRGSSTEINWSTTDFLSDWYDQEVGRIQHEINGVIKVTELSFDTFTYHVKGEGSGNVLFCMHKDNLNTLWPLDESRINFIPPETYDYWRNLGHIIQKFDNVVRYSKSDILMEGHEIRDINDHDFDITLNNNIWRSYDDPLNPNNNKTAKEVMINDIHDNVIGQSNINGYSFYVAAGIVNVKNNCDDYYSKINNFQVEYKGKLTYEVIGYDIDIQFVFTNCKPTNIEFDIIDVNKTKENNPWNSDPLMTDDYGATRVNGLPLGTYKIIPHDPSRDKTDNQFDYYDNDPVTISDVNHTLMCSVIKGIEGDGHASNIVFLGDNLLLGSTPKSGLYTPPERNYFYQLHTCYHEEDCDEFSGHDYPIIAPTLVINNEKLKTIIEMYTVCGIVSDDVYDVCGIVSEDKDINSVRNAYREIINNSERLIVNTEYPTKFLQFYDRDTGKIISGVISHGSTDTEYIFTCDYKTILPENWDVSVYIDPDMII